MSESERSLNPAADKRRMVIALAVLAGLAALSWFTIGGGGCVPCGRLQQLVVFLWRA